MANLRDAFDDRLAEIEAYLVFLDGLEGEVRRTGTPRLGSEGPIVTVDQQRILYSSVYLQLYNLVEATITRCLDAVCDAAIADGRWKPGDLSVELRREWVRSTARTHVEMTDENRLRAAVELVGHLVDALPVKPFKVEKAGGSWDDVMIEGITARIGMPLRISQPVFQGVKQHIREDRGALALIALLRNNLAHGSLSFVECGQNVVVDQLRDLKNRATLYLGEVVDGFDAWVASYEFLVPERRPA
jgi:hypothetical protein